MEFKVKETTRKVYKASRVSKDKKRLTDYEFSKTENGWIITKEIYDVDHGLQDRSEMWLPDELIETILMENIAHQHLLEKE